MKIIDISEDCKTEFNRIATHPLQAYEWGEFRKKTKIKVVRRGFRNNGKITDGFQLTIHKIPPTPFTIGYLPKGKLPTRNLLNELEKIGKENRCLFIQLEPNEGKDTKISISQFPNLQFSFHPLFTKYTFVLDLTKSEEELLSNMHPKTRYNIKIAQKYEVIINEDNSDSAFKDYLRLMKETTKRQNFYAHTENYHRLMWETLKEKGAKGKAETLNKLTAHLLTATYKSEVIVAWILFVFKDTLYYPYGASSSKYKEVMASNLMMWEAIRFGKKLGLKKFDLWGALGPNPNPKDAWYGFHRFKRGYGTELIEFVGSFDLVLSPLYNFYKITDRARWLFLRLKSVLR